jgi:flagellar basal-body rod modification protein FlgD
MGIDRVLAGPAPADQAGIDVTGARASAADATGGLATQDTFLRLLVAQLQNQNPLTPSDPMQFVSQLAQFSSLEQSLQIRDHLANIERLLAQGR